MLGFEPRISGVGSDHSANCATTTALYTSFFGSFNKNVALDLKLIIVWSQLSRKPSKNGSKYATTFSSQKYLQVSLKFSTKPMNSLK